MNIIGKHKQTFEIEYEIKAPETRYASNKPNMTLNFIYNPKQLKTYRKGLVLTYKYLKKMKRLGFKVVEQTEADNGKV